MQEEWNEHTKADYYLAQVAAEIRRVREMFTKSPRGVGIDEAFIKFDRVDDEGNIIPTSPTPSAQSSLFLEEDSPKEIEVGPDAVKDPKWARVNENAKAVWASRLGVGSLEDLNGPSGT